MKQKQLLIAFFLLLSGFAVQAKVMLPSVISNNMVLQQKSTVTIWGWTSVVNEKLKITNTWNNDTVVVQAQAGRWGIDLQTPEFGGPYTITIQSHDVVKIRNVMIGEVWLASGQSNMEMPVDSVHKGFHGVTNYQQVIKNSENPDIRMFTVTKRISDFPQDDCDGAWLEATPENVKTFSSTGYFFAKKLNADLGVPVGILLSSWGGTNAESWMKREKTTEVDYLYTAFAKLYNQNKTWPVEPGSIYNAMIHPLEKYKIRGAIWYQGEANIKNAEVYKDVMTNLINEWRGAWGVNLPFYYVQIAPFSYNADRQSEFLREAQLKTLEVPNTGMVVTNDIGSLTTIHPKQKQQVGERLALWALAKDYKKETVFSGPLFRSMRVEGKNAIIEFDYAEGLNVKGKSATCFEIAGEDQVFVPAEAKIKDDMVIVSAKNMKQPVAVRFAFSNTAQPNLFNAAGLPASAFRTDNW